MLWLPICSVILNIYMTWVYEIRIIYFYLISKLIQRTAAYLLKVNNFVTLCCYQGLFHVLEFKQKQKIPKGRDIQAQTENTIIKQKHPDNSIQNLLNKRLRKKEPYLKPGKYKLKIHWFCKSVQKKKTKTWQI